MRGGSSSSFAMPNAPTRGSDFYASFLASIALLGGRFALKNALASWFADVEGCCGWVRT
jgi:hypothetical protein